MADTSVLTACYHCGLPVMDVGRWNVLIGDKSEPMCCPGCQTVAAAIVAGGFENYYRFRNTFASQANELSTRDGEDWLKYDDPALQEAFVTTSQGHSEIRLYIEGIHCAACCWLIEQALQKKSGVQTITVNLSTHQALLRWDTAQHRLSDLLRSIHAVGYRAFPYQAAQVGQSLEKENRQQLLRLGIAGIGMMQVMMSAIALYSGDFFGIDDHQKQFMRVFALIVTLPVMFYSALPFFSNAWRHLRSFHIGMDVAISLALWIAFVASVYAVFSKTGNVYFDSISMFVFFLLLARYAENRVRQGLLERSPSSLLPLSCECLPDPAQPSQRLTVAIDRVKTADVICVKSGETIPLDAVILQGESTVNEGAFSGEQKPLAKYSGDKVFAGTINGDGFLILRVTSTLGHTRLDMI